ncbi:acyltransferase family protein [Glycomyces tenuis]|uniref:acyltransferase family protein n=1 Tax=Glycomyces tenuis TaxID=58116 RepID=UPI00041AD8B8|nr:acyltransferase family protein [Glycomyces tenuis]
MADTLTRTGPQAGTRLHYLDNLRVYLTFLVVAHHVAIAYGNLPVWPYWDAPEHSAEGLPLDLFALLNQSYMMGFFFLVSGYFTPGSLDRRDSKSYAMERLRRLGIPFLIFLVLLRPLYKLPNYLEMPAPERPSFLEYYFTERDIGPMWFVEVLLVFSLLYAWFRSRRPEAPREAAEPQRLRARHVLAFTLALGVASWLWRIAVPTGLYVPILGLPSASYMPQYAAMFAVGIVAYRRGWFHELPKRAGLLGAALIAGSIAPMALGGYAALDLENPPPGVDPSHLAFGLWDAMFAVGSMLVLLRLFQRFAAGAGPLARFLSQNAYAVYLVHAPIIVGVVAALSPIEATPVLKFLLGLVVSAPLSWVVSAALRKAPAVRRVL